jgi:hypothetical protein
MLREHIQERRWGVPWARPTDHDRAVEAKEILKVLRRAATDDRFIARLTDQGSKTLQGYHLSRRAKAALMSGDVRWVEARVGKLDRRLRTWFDCRLQQEIW